MGSCVLGNRVKGGVVEGEGHLGEIRCSEGGGVTGQIKRVKGRK